MIHDWKQGQRIRSFGTDGPGVIVLHGGPGAYGGSDTLAEGLSGKFRTLAPRQRRSGAVRLSVDIHVEDLRDLVETMAPSEPPALVGASWGAMLALAFAVKYPALCIALVGCGTFTDDARKALTSTRLERIREHIARHPRFEDDLDLPVMEQMLKWHEMTDTFSRADPPHGSDPAKQFDRQAFEETWNDMLRLQREGVYPRSFTAVSCPVVMIHGDYDPHPGTMTAECLRSYIPHLEYKELTNCGHDPSIERYARSECYDFLESWLVANTKRAPKAEGRCSIAQPGHCRDSLSTYVKPDKGA